MEHWTGERASAERATGDPATGGARPPRGFRESFRSAGAEAAFEAACTRFRPDIVHVHHLTGLSMGVPRVARGGGARVVFTLHDAWLACARGQLVDLDDARCPGPEEARCARCLAPALWAPLPVALARRMPLRRGVVRERAGALAALLGDVDLFLSPSRSLPARIGIEAEAFEMPLAAPIAPAARRPPGPLAILFLGSLLPTKGPRIALEAFARLPAGAATLTLCGPPLPWAGSMTYVDALRRRCAEVPGATLLDPVEPARVQGLLDAADVLVFPSTWDENCPLVLLEARAAGLRIVASDVPGATETAPGAVRVEPGSTEALRRALAAEVRAGQGRLPPAHFPTPDVHARDLLARYTALTGGPRIAG